MDTIPVTADTVVLQLPIPEAQALITILESFDSGIGGGNLLDRQAHMLAHYTRLTTAQAIERAVAEAVAKDDPDTWVMPERVTDTGNVLSLVRPFDPTDQDPT